MEQNLRDLLKNETAENAAGLKEGHELRFLNKMEEALPTKKLKAPISILWKVAACIAILLMAGSAGYFFSEGKHTPHEMNTEGTNITLGSFSPELKKIETYYTANINLQLSTLSFEEDSKDLVAGYMLRLQDLDKDYDSLNIELNTYGPSEATIAALIDNLKIRLELLFKLKNKLKELNTEENGRFTNETI